MAASAATKSIKNSCKWFWTSWILETILIRSQIPDKSYGTDSFQDKNGDTPQDKCAKELEQDYKKVVQKGPSIDQRLTYVFQDLAWGIFKQEKLD